jgi:hypothetical protein
MASRSGFHPVSVDTWSARHCDPPGAMQQPSRRAKLGDPNGKLVQLMARTQRRPAPRSSDDRRRPEKVTPELQRQLPGLDSLMGFFRAAGANVELTRGRWLWINGVRAEQLNHLPPPETLEWNVIVSGIALRFRWPTIGRSFWSPRWAS